MSRAQVKETFLIFVWRRFDFRLTLTARPSFRWIMAPWGEPHIRFRISFCDYFIPVEGAPHALLHIAALPRTYPGQNQRTLGVLLTSPANSSSNC